MTTKEYKDEDGTIIAYEDKRLTREDFLKMGLEAVTQRKNTHGEVESNFQTIADFWTIYKGTDFTAVDVSVMLALLKIARIKTGHGSRDNFTDIIGYAACGGELNEIG